MIENENKKIDVAKLGDEAFDLEIEYPEIKTEKKLCMLDGTIKDFLKRICGERYRSSYDEQINFIEMEALNKNKDKIKKIVDYVVNLDEKTLSFKQVNENDVLIYNFHSSFYPNEPDGQIVDTLDFKKTYIILQLIEWGVNPFEIRKYLKLNGNNNFNYAKFMEYVMDNKDILWRICYNGRVKCEGFFKAMSIIRNMYLFEPLFKNYSNTNENLKPFELGFLLKEFSGYVNDDMHFILNYLNKLEDTEQNNKMKDYLLKIPDGYLWENFLSDDDYRKKNIEKVVREKKNTQINLSNLIVDCVGFDFSKKDFEKDKDFWDLVANLNDDPVLISFFTLVAMRDISFTERQMNFIATKIKNQTVMDKLREINRNLYYKAKKYTHQYNLERHVKFGPVTAFLDYAFLKMSRGIGCVGAALFDAVLCMLPTGIGGGAMFGIVYLFFPVSALWTTTFWVVASVLSGAAALLFLWGFININADDLKSRFIEFADGMQESYENGKVVYWLESYNIKHLTNNIGEPPIEISTNLPRESDVSNSYKNEIDTHYPNNSKFIGEPKGQKKK